MASSISPSAAGSIPRVTYTAVLPSHRRANPANANANANGASGHSATGASPNQQALRVHKEGRPWSAAPLSGARLRQYDASSNIASAAAWLFATAPRGSDRIAGKIHLTPPTRERSLFLSWQGDTLRLQRRDERGTTRGVAITPSKVLWNAIELPHHGGNVDAPTPEETRVMGRLQQALNGLMQRKNAPAPFRTHAPRPQVETAAPPLPPKQSRPANPDLHSITINQVAQKGGANKPVKKVTFDLPEPSPSPSPSAKRPDRPADSGLPTQKVPRPLDVERMNVAPQALKQQSARPTTP